jgi:hypothetical protein
MDGGMNGQMAIDRGRVDKPSRHHLNAALRSQMLHLPGGYPQALSSFGHS